MILEFPTKSNTKALEKQLEGRMEELESIYDKVEIAHALVNSLEAVALETEKNFDKCLSAYAKIVGAENLEVHMLQYSQNAVAVYNEDMTWHLEWKDSDDD
jgi:hypothetical protein